MNNIYSLTIAILISATATLLSAPAHSKPVPESEKVTLDLRRTTLVVADIDRSLAFYRDALGMKVIYDNMINTPRGASDESAEKVRRLVFLRANDDYIGVLGLLQYVRPAPPTVDLSGQAFNTGTTVLVFNVEQLQERFDKATQIDGVVVLDEPTPVSYPSYDGTSTIDVLVSALQDPDGFVIELNQLQGSLR